MQIIPAILATEEEEYNQKLKTLNFISSLLDGWIQIDLMDNKFVQNRSVTPSVLNKFPTNLSIEAHLMVKFPDNWIDVLVHHKASRIIFPIEDRSGLEERITHIRQHQLKVGLSLNPNTPVSDIKPYLGDIDSVLIMSVEPGFSGQEFIPHTMTKIANLVQLKFQDNLNFKLGVDGGINAEVASKLANTGINYIVIGSHLLQGDVKENLKQIRKALGD